MKKRIKELGYWLEDRLKDFVGELTPDKRLVAILTMLLLFTALSLYFTFSAFYNFGKGKGEQIHMQHIERLELELQEKKQELKQVKPSDYDNREQTGD